MTNSPATARDDSVTMLIDGVAGEWLNDEHALTKSLGGLIQAALRDAGYTIVYRNTDADVEARAREAVAEYIEPYWDDQWDGADGVLDWLTAAGLRVVDAAQDDRRTEAIAVLRSALPDIEGWKSVTEDEGYCKPTGRSDVDLCEPVLERIRQALAEDTGGEG